MAGADVVENIGAEVVVGGWDVEDWPRESAPRRLPRRPCGKYLRTWLTRYHGAELPRNVDAVEPIPVSQWRSEGPCQ